MKLLWVACPMIVEQGPIWTHRHPVIATLPDRGKPKVLIDDVLTERTFEFICYPSDPNDPVSDHREAVCLVKGVDFSSIYERTDITYLSEEFDESQERLILSKTPNELNWVAGETGKSLNKNKSMKQIINDRMLLSSPKRLIQ